MTEVANDLESGYHHSFISASLVGGVADAWAENREIQDGPIFFWKPGAFSQEMVTRTGASDLVELRTQRLKGHLIKEYTLNSIYGIFLKRDSGVSGKYQSYTLQLRLEEQDSAPRFRVLGGS